MSIYSDFYKRHCGTNSEEIKTMLEVIGVSSLEQLIQETVPASIQRKASMQLPAPLGEFDFITDFKQSISKNKVFRSFIGMGYNDCITPPVIQRNILENPGWYTAYTPYQAEIAQGRLEALINYQTMVTDLTGMEMANASLLDEATAAAEAVSLLYASRDRSKKTAHTFFIDQNTLPQTIDLILGRTEPLGIKVEIGDPSTLDLSREEFFGALLQYPNANGAIHNPENFIAQAQKHHVKIGVCADLLALTLLKSPGEMGADVVVGTSQRFGIPLGYGGPHAAFFATKTKYMRHIPGRIIGVSQDKNGNLAYRMSLQTREQHIKRERATSNICTAQVLLAVMAGMYAVYHGKEGLINIAKNIHAKAATLNEGLQALGYTQENTSFFDTLKVKVEDVKDLKNRALAKEINLNYFEKGYVGISIHEKTTLKDVEDILQIFGKAVVDESNSILSANYYIDSAVQRTSPFLAHPIFNCHHTEHEMLRYIKKLENKDLSLVHSMIALGSCTMKLNATTEMLPLSWSEVNGIHPFAPVNQTEGYQELFKDLAQWLAEITGLYTTSLQPNSGAQGEYAGLMVIRAYFEHLGQSHRNITLIPSSAHGTNPASAVMAGQKVVIVNCLDNGDIDIEDLKQKAAKYSDNVMALMVTYPSTHGVFEERIKEACEIVHSHGGKVYLDGANLNAQIGLTSPGDIGADVCHLNLHKTFCIPHGGGGPGMGPIAVSKDLAPFIPGNALIKEEIAHPIKAISAAPWGSASILTISYAYIRLMGAAGLKSATEMAILNANYIKDSLKEYYPILFTGLNDRSAHELIIDCRNFKSAEVAVTDIAKRLMDYGYHAPTVSFPVVGTMMIEPTESESKEELDRFINAMISIRKEIAEIEDGIAPVNNNVLVNAPHTAATIMADGWEFPYSRQKAAFPLPYVMEHKFWPSVGRIDDAFGDRNLMCSCPAIENYEDNTEVVLH